MTEKRKPQGWNRAGLQDLSATEQHWREVCDASRKAYGENNDCAVRAVAIACNVKYDVAWKALRALGRVPGHGIYSDAKLEAAQALGFQVEQVKVKSKTIRTLERELREGAYLVSTKGHAVPLVAGKAWDHTSGRMKRVHRVHRVWKDAWMGTGCQMDMFTTTRGGAK